MKHLIIRDDWIAIDNDRGRWQNYVDVLFDIKMLYIHKTFDKISTKTEATDGEVDGM